MWSPLLASVALGADPPVAEEITVYGDPEVEAARQQLIGDITGLGYDKRIRHKNGRTVYFHDDHWRGKVVLYDDGRFWAKRTGPRIYLPPHALFCVTRPTECLKAGAWLVSDRRWGNVEDTLASSTADSEVALGDRIADASVKRTVADLPERLTALWEAGTPLTPGAPVLATKAERRAAIFAYYDSRTDTVWGDEVRGAVGSFVRGVVMQSEDPYTGDELAAFER
jgi:hypothetical protein